MSRKLIVLLAAVVFGGCSKVINTAKLPDAESKPNIIFILVDDMGYGDLPLYGNAGVATPNIDYLAAEGVRFSQFYVNSPICSPSRVAFTTGQYPLRWNITSFLADSSANIRRGMDQYLNIEAPSLARLLKQSGYYTAHVGKWHMGGQRNVEGAPLITDFGFDSSLTSFEGLGERLGWLFETFEWDGSNRFPLSVQQEKLGHGPVTWIKRHDETRIYMDRALNEIKKAQSSDQPFYLNFWTSDVHLPVETLPALRGDSSIRSQYLGMISDLDNQLGRLFDYVRNDSELRDNTIIILTSDNGPAPGHGSSGGLRGHKGQLYEGGIREPFIVWAGGNTAPAMTGKVNYKTVVAGIDLAPTILSIAGISTPETLTFDGIDMKETWLGKSADPRAKPVMWVRPPGTQGPKREFHDLAIRDGKWKLLTNIDGGKTELYDMDTNPGESVNLVLQHPELASKLSMELRDWFYNIRGKTPAALKPWLPN